jgi:exodeoxyribonuclease V beta subunit
VTTPRPDPASLDLRTPLPPGLSVVEASAGTGKTFTLTALAVRALVVDGLGCEQLLVMTFTRAAAAELRARIRSGLREALDLLRVHASADGTVREGRGRTGDPRGDGSEHEQALPEWLDAIRRTGPDPAGPLLTASEAAVRAATAARALATLDRATIATLHGFCQASLAQLGLRGTGSDRRLNPDTDRLRRDIVRDRLLAELADDPDGLSYAGRDGLESPGQVETRIAELVRTALASSAVVLPAGRSDLPLADANARLVASIVDAMRRRLDAEGELSFDELVLRLHELLEDAHAGPVAARRLRARSRLVMIDEMQDTDVLQWSVIRRAFLDAPDVLGPMSDVVIVGDPKQSIYRFRGADIHAYLAAAREAGPRSHSLAVNWRSSAPLLGGLEVLLGGATFGDPSIAFRPVEARPAAAPRLDGVDAPIELRHLRIASGVELSTRGLPEADAAREVIRADLCARVVELLATGRITDPEAPVAQRDVEGRRALGPGDLAVLVRSNREAATIVEALVAVGVPAVQPKGGDVFGTEALRQWRVLLAALADPVDPDRVRALLLTWFTAAGIAAVDDEILLDALRERCLTWRDLLGTAGVLPLLAALRADPEVAGALAAAGERGITDLEHLAELTHVACGGRGVPAAVAMRTLEDLSLAHDLGDEDGDDPAVRRIDSDGRAVQVMTFHRAKGLEFPVVLLPDSFRQVTNKKPWSFRSGGRRVVDAASGQAWRPQPDPASPFTDEDGLTHATKASREARSKEEILGDEARLLYVALTRAQEHLVVWWAPTQGADSAKLSQLLLAPRDDDGLLGPSAAAPALKDITDESIASALTGLVRSADEHAASMAGVVGPLLRVSEVPVARVVVPHHRHDVAEEVELAVARLARPIAEHDVWRWSFTGLLRGTDPLRHPAAGDGHGSGFGDGPGGDGTDPDAGDADPSLPRGGSDEPEPVAFDDELVLPDGSVGDATTGPVAGDPLGDLVDLPGGTAFGVLVHEALEVVDLSAPDVTARLTQEVALRAARSTMPLDVERVARGLHAALITPLDPVAPGMRLHDVPPADRVHELTFDLPLGDTHTGIDIAALAGAVSDALAPDDPYRATFATLPQRIDRRRIGGWLTGVIDLALRLPDGRYLVADYKSNRLTDAADRPAYDVSAMRAAMLHGEYPLQAILYLVGLHRLLERRLPGYDPDIALGGAAFLFLRGMAGPDTPLRDGVRDGVCMWRPATATILAADDALRDGVLALHGGASGARRRRR